MPWYAFVYEDPIWVERFKRKARSYAEQLDHEQLYHDAVQGLILRLIEKSDQLPQKDPNSVDTQRVVTQMFNRALVDEFRRHRGRNEVPHWLRPFGRLGRLLHQLRCKDKLPTAEVARVAAASTPDPADEMPSPEAYREAVAQVVSHPRWPTVCRVSRDGTGDPEQIERLPDKGDAPDDESGVLDALVGMLLGQTGDAATSAAQRLRLQGPPPLDEDDVFVLRAHYQEGMGISAIARHLGKQRHVIDYQHKQALQRIQRWLGQSGIGRDDVL